MDVIRLLEVRPTPLSVDEAMQAVADPAAGGTTVFVGTVRDEDGGRSVAALEYEAHPSVEERLRAVAEKVVADFPVLRLAVTHRVGPLQIGDIAVVVAIACAHRGEAFAACRRMIDDLKAEVPIWKHQVFTDGEEEWVGAP